MGDDHDITSANTILEVQAMDLFNLTIVRYDGGAKKAPTFAITESTREHISSALSPSGQLSRVLAGVQSLYPSMLTHP